MLKEIVAEAVRVEIEEKTGRVFLVFEIKNEKLKQNIKQNWTNDIHYTIIDKYLIEDKE
jgi:hypothetical protein